MSSLAMLAINSSKINGKLSSANKVVHRIEGMEKLYRQELHRKKCCVKPFSAQEWVPGDRTVQMSGVYEKGDKRYRICISHMDIANYQTIIDTKNAAANRPHHVVDVSDFRDICILFGLETSYPPLYPPAWCSSSFSQLILTEAQKIAL